MVDFIPAAKPIIGDEEREAVDRVLRSGMIAQGQMCIRDRCPVGAPDASVMHSFFQMLRVSKAGGRVLGC